MKIIQQFLSNRDKHATALAKMAGENGTADDEEDNEEEGRLPGIDEFDAEAGTNTEGTNENTSDETV